MQKRMTGNYLRYLEEELYYYVFGFFLGNARK